VYEQITDSQNMKQNALSGMLNVRNGCSAVVHQNQIQQTVNT